VSINKHFVQVLTNIVLSLEFTWKKKCAEKTILKYLKILLEIFRNFISALLKIILLGHQNN